MRKYAEWKRMQEYNLIDKVVNVLTARLNPEVWNQISTRAENDALDLAQRRMDIWETGIDPVTAFDEGVSEQAQLTDEILLREAQRTMEQIRKAESAITTIDSGK